MAVQPSANSARYIERRIFVGGLPSGVTEDECRRCFNEFGRVVEVVLIYGNEDRKPRGFGFVTFDSDEAVQRVTEIRFLRLREKMVEVKRAEPYMGRKRETNTVETSRLQLPSSSTFNPFYYSYYPSPSCYDPVYYSHYFPYYCSFYNPFSPSDGGLPIQYNYYPYVHEVGGPCRTLTGDYFGSSSSSVPYNPSPMNADPIPISGGETTSRIGPGGSNASAVGSSSNGFDKVPNTSTESWQDKLVHSIGNLQIGSSSAANTEQNGDDQANNSEVEAKSQENKVDDGMSLNSTGGNPCNP